MKPSIEKLSTMFTKLNTTVPFSNVDYYANQIEIIFEVSEVEAYELVQQLKETIVKTLQITGFKHVTTTGIARLFQELDSYGTIGMLYELTGEQMANMLMNIRHFNQEAYITVPKESPEYDNLMIEIHDELVDAYTMVTWCYSHMLNDIAINERTITNLSSALEIEIPEWEYTTISINELEGHCANTTHIEPVHVRLFAHEDGHSYQRFEWIIDDAAEFHTFSSMYFAIKALYPNATIQLV